MRAAASKSSLRIVCVPMRASTSDSVEQPASAIAARSARAVDFTACVLSVRGYNENRAGTLVIDTGGRKLRAGAWEMAHSRRSETTWKTWRFRVGLLLAATLLGGSTFLGPPSDPIPNLPGLHESLQALVIARCDRV